MTYVLDRVAVERLGYYLVTSRQRVRMKISDIMQICFSNGLDGKKTDKCVQTVAINLLKEELPVTAIEMKSQEGFLRMLKGADAPHMFIDGGTVHFNALYSVTKGYPAPRIYFVRARLFDDISRIGMYLEMHGIKLPLVNSERFGQLIEEKEYRGRYQSWRDQWEAKTSNFKGLLDGRIENTAIDKGIWLESGGCLICGEKTDLMSTASVIGGAGLMIGLKLCQKHTNEARDDATLLEYVAKKSGIPPPFFGNVKIVRHTNETLAMSIEAVKEELCCDIEKVEDKTITAVRRSGFRIICRQDSVTDYAYNIQDPKKTPIARIDSADHHLVPYGPDHIHRDLKKSKKNRKSKGVQVESSFTYGFAVADLKVIKRLVEEAEARWLEKEVN